MNATLFVDTSILVYALDLDAGRKTLSTFLVGRHDRRRRPRQRSERTFDRRFEPRRELRRRSGPEPICSDVIRAGYSSGIEALQIEHRARTLHRCDLPALTSRLGLDGLQKHVPRVFAAPLFSGYRA